MKHFILLSVALSITACCFADTVFVYNTVQNTIQIPDSLVNSYIQHELGKEGESWWQKNTVALFTAFVALLAIGANVWNNNRQLKNQVRTTIDRERVNNVRICLSEAIRYADEIRNHIEASMGLSDFLYEEQAIQIRIKAAHMKDNITKLEFLLIVSNDEESILIPQLNSLYEDLRNEQLPFNEQEFLIQRNNIVFAFDEVFNS